MWGNKCGFKMLTMAGNRGPMMVETRGLKEVISMKSSSKTGKIILLSYQANIEKPKWDEEELETRTSVMSLVKLHDCQLENCHVARLYFLFCCHVAMFPTCTSTFVAMLPCFLLYLFLLPGGGKGRVYRGRTKETDHCGHERPRCWR